MLDSRAIIDNRYCLEKQLTEGNFTRLFKAIDNQTNRPVLISVFDANQANNPELLQNFRQKGQLASKLSHPNLLSAIAYGEYEQQPYVVLPLMQGTRLQSWLKRGPFSPEAAAHLLEQVAPALDYLQSRKVELGLLTPQNLLTLSDGRVLVMGLEQLVCPALAQPNPVADRLPYLPPEGQSQASANVFALGLIVCQFLTGQLPLKGQPPWLVGQAALQNVPAEKLQAIEKVVQKALANSPAERFQSAGPLAAAYRAALTGTSLPQILAEPVAVAATPLPGKLSTNNPPSLPNLEVKTEVTPAALPVVAVKRRKWPLVVILLGFMVLLAGGGVGIAMNLLNLPKPEAEAVLTTSTIAPIVTKATSPVTSAPILPVALSATNPTSSPILPPTATIASATVAPTVLAATALALLPAPAVKVPDNFLLYRNADPKQLNLEIGYPQNWSVSLQPDGTGLTLADTSGTTTFSIFRASMSSSTSISVSMEEYNARFIESYKKDNWSQRTDSRFWAFAGEKWLQSSFQKGNSRTWLLVAIHKSVAYAVVLRGEDSTFDKYLAEIVGKMWDTLHFLDGPINYYSGEVKTFVDPKNLYAFNYPFTRWNLDTNAAPKLVGKDNSTSFGFYDTSSSNQSMADLLNTYRERLSQNGQYPNLKETIRFKLINSGDTQEQSLRFSFSQNDEEKAGELLIRKHNDFVYVAVAVSDSADMLDTIYFDLWRYTDFLK